MHQKEGRKEGGGREREREHEKEGTRERKKEGRGRREQEKDAGMEVLQEGVTAAPCPLS
jgi:hypothetical protein